MLFAAEQSGSNLALVITAVVGGIVAILAAVGALWLQISNGRAAVKKQELVDAIAAEDRKIAAEERKLAADERRLLLGKSDAIIVGNTKIHELTNSANSNLQKALELMTQRHSGAQETILALQQEKKDTATARVLTDRQTSQASAGVQPALESIPETTKSLKEIAKNTEAIDENTRRTEDKIDDIKKDTAGPGVLEPNGRKGEKHVGESHLHE